MPIYAYKCSACGHTQDALQKMSADALTVCPACGQSTYSKQVTAPQFQLKGSGWYVTDFRGGSGAKDSKAEPATSESKSESATESKGESKSEAKTESAAPCPVHSTPTPATAPAKPAAAKE